MSLNFNKIENTIFCINYYNNIKNINDNYLNYIKTYANISKEYYQKLLNLKNDNFDKIKDNLENINKNKDINLNITHINLINIIPKIIDLYIENLNYLFNK